MHKAALGERSAAPVQTSDARPTDRNRRRFLLTLGVSGAGAAVAVGSALPGTRAGGIAATAPEDESGYRETAHVRDYYRTAKI